MYIPLQTLSSRWTKEGIQREWVLSGIRQQPAEPMLRHHQPPNAPQTTVLCTPAWQRSQQSGYQELRRLKTHVPPPQHVVCLSQARGVARMDALIVTIGTHTCMQYGADATQ